MKSTLLGTPANTTPESKFDWLIRSMRRIETNSQTTVIASSTFAKLPATPSIGEVFYITDSSTATWAATIAGGGANKVLGWWNGTHWTVVAA